MGDHAVDPVASIERSATADDERHIVIDEVPLGELIEDLSVDVEDSKPEYDEETTSIMEDDEVDDEMRAKIEYKKKMKKREQKRQAHLKLRGHFKDMEDEKRQSSKPILSAEVEADELNEGEEGEEGEEGDEIGDLGEGAEGDELDVKSIISSSDDDDYSRRVCAVSFKGDFFQNFLFPSLSDITTESEEVAESARPTLEEKEADKEKKLSEPETGQFVDAAGVDQRPTFMAEEEHVREAQQDLEEVSEETSSSSISFDWPFPLEDEPPVAPAIDATEFALGMLIEMDSTLRIVPAVSTGELETVRIELANRQICIDLLYRIIDDVVETAEYVNPLKLLLSRLDKPKLLSDLHNVISECFAAKQFNSDLTNKMFDYYRRVGQLRCFDPLLSQQELKEYKRHREALAVLDHLKKKAAETKANYVWLMASVIMDLNYVRKISLTTVDSLENCFRTTLLRKDFEVMPRIVEHELRRMQSLRNEISDSRLGLITRQHTLGRLIERKRQFDQITADLTMDQFLNAQRDVIALGTKVEERNHDLIRMRDRCTKHVHQLAFIREKMSMISAALCNYKLDLDEKMERQAELRDQLFTLKIEHANLKNQKALMQEKSGLLYRPALLHDFDKTVELVEMKRKIVTKLRRIVVDLESRIDLYEVQARSSITSHSIASIRKFQKIPSKKVR